MYGGVCVYNSMDYTKMLCNGFTSYLFKFFYVFFEYFKILNWSAKHFLVYPFLPWIIYPECCKILSFLFSLTFKILQFFYSCSKTRSASENVISKLLFAYVICFWNCNFCDLKICNFCLWEIHSYLIVTLLYIETPTNPSQIISICLPSPNHKIFPFELSY